MDENKEIQEEIQESIPESEIITQEPEKPCKKKGLIIVLGIVAVFLAVIIGLTVFAICDINGVYNKKDTSVVIKKGTPTVVLAEQLEEEDIIESSLLFRVFCRIKGYDSSFKYGAYKFSKGMGYEEIANKLMTEGAVAESVSVTIPEGTSISDYTKDVNGQDVTVPGIATLLEKSGVCTKEDFFEALSQVELSGNLLNGVNSKQAYLPLEGYLFPDTYEFYFYNSKECAALAIKKMLSHMEDIFTQDMIKRAEELNMSVNEVLTLASIVQMEAGLDTGSMPKVAAVFYNRMNRGENLGSSPTCYYGDAFKNDDGRYNTYNIKGLPPGPLCSPGKEAINAVLYPEQNFTEYFYFVTDSKGKFYFHRTYEEQNVTINRLRQENNWIYEYFD